MSSSSGVVVMDVTPEGVTVTEVVPSNGGETTIGEVVAQASTQNPDAVEETLTGAVKKVEELAEKRKAVEMEPKDGEEEEEKEPAAKKAAVEDEAAGDEGEEPPTPEIPAEGEDE